AETAADHQIRVLHDRSVMDADRQNAGTASTLNPDAPMLETRIVDHKKVGAGKRSPAFHQSTTHRHDGPPGSLSTADRDRGRNLEALRERARAHHMSVAHARTRGYAEDTLQGGVRMEAHQTAVT